MNLAAHTDSNPGPNSLVPGRAALLAVAAQNLALKWVDYTHDLKAEALARDASHSPVNRSYELPNISRISEAYSPGFEALGPCSGTVPVSEELFCDMFSKGRWPDLDFIKSARPPNPTAENDALWGMVNYPNIMALLRTIDHVRPQRALVIGAGTGLVEALIAQAMPDGSSLTAIDCGNIETRYPISPHGKSYRRPIDEIGLFGFLNIAFQKGLVGPGSGKANVDLHEIDSQVFLEQALRERTEGYDFILVDGNHAYLNGTLDVLRAFALLNKNGLLFIDDWNRLYHSQGVVHGAGLLAYHCGVQVWSLDRKGNKNLVDSSGNPPNMVFACKRADAIRPVDAAIDTSVPGLLRSIRADVSA